jgi:hypothetical protein
MMLLEICLVVQLERITDAGHCVDLSKLYFTITAKKIIE